MYTTMDDLKRMAAVYRSRAYSAMMLAIVAGILALICPVPALRRALWDVRHDAKCDVLMMKIYARRYEERIRSGSTRIAPYSD